MQVRTYNNQRVWGVWRETKRFTMVDKLNFNVNDKDLEQTRDLEQIKLAFTKMYNSLAKINFCRGGTVGMAQQKALDQMSSFVKIKTTQDHPLNEFLKNLDSEHRKTTAEHIMKSSSSNNVFDDNIVANNYRQMAESELKTSLKNFNSIYRKYPGSQLGNDKGTQININQQKLIQMYLQMVQQKSREPRGR